MKRFLTLSAVWLALLALVLPGLAPGLHAQSASVTHDTTPDIPRLISYQGLLSNSSGQPVTDGLHKLTIRFYTDSIGQTPAVWEDTFDVTTQNGVFSILLGSQQQLPGPTVMGQPLWLGVAVDGVALNQLSQLSASPYAMTVANGAITAEKMGTDYVGSISINGSKVTGQGGNLNLTGSNGVSLNYDPVANAIVFSGGGSTAASGKGKETLGSTQVAGTQHEVLANGTYGSYESGNVTLTTPQAIDTSSSPRFANLTLTKKASVADTLTTSTIVTTNAIVPNKDTEISLGDRHHKFKDLYLGPHSLVMGSGQDMTTFEVGSGGLTITQSDSTSSDSMKLSPTGSVSSTSLTADSSATIGTTLTTGGAITSGDSITAATSITAGGPITSNDSITAATSITAGGPITSNDSITAATSITAGGPITSNDSITAGTSITAGGPITSNDSITAGTSITSGGAITSGDSIAAQGTITSGNSITVDGHSTPRSITGDRTMVVTTTSGDILITAPAGNVGVGIDYPNSPAYLLDVNGTLHAAGAATFSGNTNVDASPSTGGTIAVGNASSTTNMYGAVNFSNSPSLPLAQNNLYVGNSAGHAAAYAPATNSVLITDAVSGGTPHWATTLPANLTMSTASINTPAISGGTISGSTISGGSMSGTPISGSTGSFTTLAASGATTLSSTLNVAGATTTNGVTNTGDITTGTLHTTSAATLNSASVTNNAAIGGTLGVTGNTNLSNVTTSGNAAVTGNATVGGTLAVTGNTSLSNVTASGNAAVTGNATVGGTLGVTGNTSLSNVTASGNAAVTGNATVGGTLGVTGTSTTNGVTNTGDITTGTLHTTSAATLNSASVTNNATVGGTLGVTGASTTNGVTNTGDIATGTLHTTSAATLNSASVTNNATVGGTLGVTGASTTNGVTNTGDIATGTLHTTSAATLNSASVTNNATVGGTLTVTGTSTFNDHVGIGTSPTSYALDVNGDAHVSGAIHSGSTVTMDGTTTPRSLSSDEAMTITTSTGDITMNPAGNLDLDSHRITGIVDPMNPQDAATKNYVDNATAAQTAALDAAVNGTANYVAKFTGSNSIGNSLIYDDGTHVGIGTASPAAMLSVGTGSPLQVDASGNLSTSGSLTVADQYDAALVVNPAANPPVVMNGYTGSVTFYQDGRLEGSSDISADAYLFANLGIVDAGGLFTVDNLGSVFAQRTINTNTGYQVAGVATSGEYLRGNGTNFVSSAIQAADVPTLNQNTTGTAANANQLESNTWESPGMIGSSTPNTGAFTAVVVSSGLNISGGNLLTNGASRLDGSGNLFNIGSLSLSGSIGTATTITASGLITGGSLVSNGPASFGGDLDMEGHTIVNVAHINNGGGGTIAIDGNVDFNNHNLSNLGYVSLNSTSTISATSGTVNFGSNVDMRNNSIFNVSYPINAQDAATKNYVDNSIAAIPSATSVAWGLSGNSGTTPGANFLGTTDSKALYLDVNGSPNWILNTNGSVQRDAGGNARGSNAVDLQNSRNFASQIASGNTATIGGGINNTANGDYSIVGGGATNAATYGFAAVGGGSGNTASSIASLVSGGYQNTAGGAYASVSGGTGNSSSQYAAAISGGFGNTAGGQYSTIGGGQNNSASNSYSSVGGGLVNQASGIYSTVSGGEQNSASIDYSFVGGGYQNQANGNYSTVGGGANNTASTDYATASGGFMNTALGNFTAVAGGYQNNANGHFSAIPGGVGLTLSGNGSFGFLGNNTGTHNMTIAAANTSVLGNTDLWLANNDNTARALYFYAPNSATGAFPGSTNYVGFKAGAVTTSTIWTLPLSDGTNGQVLSTDGAGTLNWTSNISGTASNANQLESQTWEAPGTIGSALPNTGTFTDLAANGRVNFTGTGAASSATNGIVFDVENTGSSGTGLQAGAAGSGNAFSAGNSGNGFAIFTVNTGTGGAISANAASGDAIDANVTSGSGVGLNVSTVNGNAINAASTGGLAINATGNAAVSGTLSLGAALNMNSHPINSVTDPTNAQDAATKNYVDGTALPSGAVVQFTSAGSHSGYTYTQSSMTTFGGGNTWAGIGSMPSSRNGSTAVALNGKIYVMGGNGGSTTVYMYDPVTDTWSTKASMNAARDQFSSAVYNGKIYVFGGQYYTNSAEVYDPVANSWSYITAPATVHDYTNSAATLGDKIYLAGGFNGYTGLNTLEAYDPATDTWSSKATFTTARSACGLAAAAGKLYLIGGNTGGSPLGDVQRYDPTTNSWSTVASLNAGVRYPAIGVINDKIYVDGDLNTTSQVYDPALDTWTNRAAMSTTRGSSCGAALDGYFYEIGGSSLSSVERLNTAMTVYFYSKN